MSLSFFFIYNEYKFYLDQGGKQAGDEQSREDRFRSRSNKQYSIYVFRSLFHSFKTGSWGTHTERCTLSHTYRFFIAFHILPACLSEGGHIVVSREYFWFVGEMLSDDRSALSYWKDSLSTLDFHEWNFSKNNVHMQNSTDVGPPVKEYSNQKGLYEFRRIVFQYRKLIACTWFLQSSIIVYYKLSVIRGLLLLVSSESSKRAQHKRRSKHYSSFWVSASSFRRLKNGDTSRELSWSCQKSV